MAPFLFILTMFSYWDLYVAYVNKCVRDNWVNDIDPAHYRMEWNHWLPKSCFPDLPLGQWLTLKQHAIASALQSLALGKNCMCGWHKKYLPKELLELAWPIYRAKNDTFNKELHKEKDELGRSLHAFKYLISTDVKDQEGRSLRSIKAGRASAQRRKELNLPSGFDLLAQRRLEDPELDARLLEVSSLNGEIWGPINGKKNKGRKHSPEVNAKKGSPGEKNGMYGKIRVTNGKENKQVNSEEEIPEGYWRGLTRGSGR